MIYIHILPRYLYRKVTHSYKYIIQYHLINRETLAVQFRLQIKAVFGLLLDANKHPGKKSSDRTYDRLRLLQCVDWGIPEDIMLMMPVWINEVFDGSRLSAVQVPALLEVNLSLLHLEDRYFK